MNGPDLTALRSPNFGARRGGLLPELVVLHYTAMESCAASAARLCDPEAEVSAHYLIDLDGRVLALVDETERAWHAGAGSWAGREDVNSRSIGIELQNTGRTPFPEPQMRALEGLLPEIMARWSIPPEAVIGHSDMAPGRKVDPGGRFDWQRLARQGLSVWPAEGHETGLSEAGFRRDLLSFGYPDVPLDLMLSAFRLRFRPWAMGALAEQDCVLALDLAARFGAPSDFGS